MARPYCRTCWFCDLENPDPPEPPGGEEVGLCRSGRPYEWSNVRLDIDYCGRHQALALWTRLKTWVGAGQNDPPEG
jgi:hypothetical protein